MYQVSSVWHSPIKNKVRGNFTRPRANARTKYQGGNGLVNSSNNVCKTQSESVSFYFKEISRRSSDCL